MADHTVLIEELVYEKLYLCSANYYFIIIMLQPRAMKYRQKRVRFSLILSRNVYSFPILSIHKLMGKRIVLNLFKYLVEYDTK